MPDDAKQRIRDTDDTPEIRRRPGRCTTHDDFAWLYDDGSIGCMGALILETSASDCFWERVPVPVRTELGWLVENSDGVAGLKIDGLVMLWSEVIAKYLPSYFTSFPPSTREF